MSGFWKCVLYAAALALLAHPLGQAIPGPFDPEKRPFRSRKWEQNGRVYTIMLGDMYAATVRCIDGIRTFAAGMYPDLAK